MTTYIQSLTLPAFVFEQPAVSILLPIVLGTGVGFSTQPERVKKQYAAIKQPPLRPPPWVFGPMWTFLYASMGYAAYRAWTTGMDSFDARKVLLAKQGATLYSIQLGLNLAFMPLFFGLKRPIEAAVDIVATTATVGYLTYVWGQVDKVAGWALVPYLAWLSFASYITVGAGHLNDWDFKNKDVYGTQKAD